MSDYPPYRTYFSRDIRLILDPKETASILGVLGQLPAVKWALAQQAVRRSLKPRAQQEDQ